MGNSDSRNITISWTVNGRTQFDTFNTNNRRQTTFVIDDLGCRFVLNRDATVSLRHPSNYTIKDHYIQGSIYHIDLIPNVTVPNSEPAFHTKLLRITSEIETIHILRT
jgi:hypothetical protein